LHRENAANKSGLLTAAKLNDFAGWRKGKSGQTKGSNGCCANTKTRVSTVAVRKIESRMPLTCVSVLPQCHKMMVYIYSKYGRSIKYSFKFYSVGFFSLADIDLCVF